MSSKRSQYSMEFLTFFAIVSVIFVVWMSIYLTLSEDSFKQRDERAINDLGKAIQSHIFLASKVRSGYKSTELVIPSRAGPVEFIVNNSNYVFYLRVDKQDYIFNIPYSVGKLKKGNNTLWNLNGVVAIGDHPPLIRPDGNVNFTRCSDSIDNDNDGDIDKDDTDCGDPYDWQDDSESS